MSSSIVLSQIQWIKGIKCETDVPENEMKCVFSLFSPFNANVEYFRSILIILFLSTKMNLRLPRENQIFDRFVGFIETKSLHCRIENWNSISLLYFLVSIWHKIKSTKCWVTICALVTKQNIFKWHSEWQQCCRCVSRMQNTSITL